MRTHGGPPREESEAAAREGGQGFLIGSIKWGAAGLALGGLGYAGSPVYRRLTIQFKAFLQIGVMVMGGSLEADRRIRQFEARMRVEKRMRKDQILWESYSQSEAEK